MKSIVLIFLMISFFCSNAQTKYDRLIKDGIQLLKDQNVAEAITKYQQAFMLDSTRVEANYGLGTAYLYDCQNSNMNCNKSLSFLNKAIAIDDTYRNGYYNRGKCKGFMQDFQGALVDFTNAIAQTPNNKDSYFSRGMIKIKLHDNQGACEDFYKSGLRGSELAKKMFEANCRIEKKNLD